MVYQWKGAGNQFSKLDAQIVGEQLEQIRADHGGRLTPDDVVAAASDPGSPLHSAFDWDDASAAANQRKHMARVLMNSIRCVVRVQTATGEQERTTRALVSVRDAEGKHYAPITVVLASDDYRQQLMVQASKDLQSFKRKYAELDELVGLFTAIDVVLPLLAAGQEAAA